MFEHMTAEDMKMNNKSTCSDNNDGIDSFVKPVEIRPSLIDRTLLNLGDVMINVGLKLKERCGASLTTEQSQAPDFLIML